MSPLSWIFRGGLLLVLFACQHSPYSEHVILERNKAERPAWWVETSAKLDQSAVVVKNNQSVLVFRNFTPPLAPQLAKSLDLARLTTEAHLRDLVEETALTTANSTGINLGEEQTKELGTAISAIMGRLQKNDVSLKDLYFERVGDASGDRLGDYFRAGMLIEYERALPERLVAQLGDILDSSRKVPLRKLADHLHDLPNYAISH